MCKPHILNDFDCKGEFPVDIIEPYTIYDNESGQLAKIKGFVSSKYSFHLKYDGDYYFTSKENHSDDIIDDILELPDSLENLDNYHYIYLEGWTPRQILK